MVTSDTKYSFDFKNLTLIGSYIIPIFNFDKIIFLLRYHSNRQTKARTKQLVYYINQNNYQPQNFRYFLNIIYYIIFYIISYHLCTEVKDINIFDYNKCPKSLTKKFWHFIILLASVCGSTNMIPTGLKSTKLRGTNSTLCHTYLYKTYCLFFKMVTPFHEFFFQLC